MRLHVPFLSKSSNGYTIIEIMFSIFIFALVSTSIFKVIQHIDRLRGRALFVATVSQLASDEAERIRNNAAQNASLEDSSYIVTVSERMFLVERKIVNEDDASPSFLPRAREPDVVEITISDYKKPEQTPMQFKFLQGYDNP
jgi:type II secretory pathway pseudopilin PulG